MFSSIRFVPAECTVCGGQGGHHYPWCGHAGRIMFGSCRHYFVKEGGRWVCTLCGESR